MQPISRRADRGEPGAAPLAPHLSVLDQYDPLFPRSDIPILSLVPGTAQSNRHLSVMRAYVHARSAALWHAHETEKLLGCWEATGR